MRRVAFGLSVASADRVTGLLSIFLGRLDRPLGTETFDPKQGVEMRWRELTGAPPSGKLVRLLEKKAPGLRETVLTAPLPGAGAAAAAIDVISALHDDSGDDLEGLSRISGLALRVAMEMDGTPAPAPDGQSSWAAYELRSQAGLFDLFTEVTAASVDQLRTESGMRSMTYRNAMKFLLR